MAYKLLVIDVDGTLLNEQNTISEEDKSAIDQARKRGVIVSLCTGRVHQASRNVLAELKLDGYHIFSDGAVVSDAANTRQIYTRTIENNTFKDLVDYIHQHNINTIDVFSINGHYVEPTTEPWVIHIRKNFFGLEPAVINFSELVGKEKITKATMAVASVQDKAKARAFSDTFKGRLRLSSSANVTFPEVEFVNIIDPGVSKAEALKFLASYLEVPLEEVIAIGDGKNDIPLLLCAGMSVAMGHAPEEVKKCAHYVTLDVAHSGVAAAIKKFIL